MCIKRKFTVTKIYDYVSKGFGVFGQMSSIFFKDRKYDVTVLGARLAKDPFLWLAKEMISSSFLTMLSKTFGQKYL